MTDRSPADLGAAAVHDVRSGVGSIRLAATSVMADGGDDAEFRHEMLTTIEAETRRLDAALTGLQALIAAFTDRADATVVAIDDVLRQTVAEAARRQVVATVTTADDARLQTRPSLSAVLAALLGLAADSGGDVSIAASRESRGVVVRIARADGGAVRSERALVQSLVFAAGAEPCASSDAIELRLPHHDAV